MTEDSILAHFAKYIEMELGIIYSGDNYFQLKNRLEEIARGLEVPTIEELFLKSKDGFSAELRQQLLDVATNNETSFFRDPKVFSAIENVVLPAFLENEHQTKDLRVWSAASSAGQEALSLGILIEESKKKMRKEFSFSIVGTDISERILKRAKSGLYSELEISRGLSENLKTQYFQKVEQGGWKAKLDLLRHINFRKQNLLDPFASTSSYYLVLCRNVLIYQNVKSKVDILRRVFETLVPGGFLVLGSGESLLGLSDRFEQVPYGGAVIYRKAAEKVGEKTRCA